MARPTLMGPWEHDSHTAFTAVRAWRHKDPDCRRQIDGKESRSDDQQICPDRPEITGQPRKKRTSVQRYYRGSSAALCDCSSPGSRIKPRLLVAVCLPLRPSLIPGRLSATRQSFCFSSLCLPGYCFRSWMRVWWLSSACARVCVWVG